MDTAPTKVSIREFRSRLAHYAGTSSPIAITRHGETVGYFIPARPSPDKAEIAALREAGARLEALLAEAGLSEKELLSEFRGAAKRQGVVAIKKALVLDANILIRAVLGRKVRALLEESSPSISLFTPDICFEDADKYLPALFEKRQLPSEPALNVLAHVSRMVQTVESDVYREYEEQAKQRIAMRDPNDWPIVATALALDCPIWTEDADFFGSGIATWTTDRIHLFVALAK